MKTENRHINFQEPEGMMLLRYIKDTASNEEKSYIEAWLEADENNKRILLQTARIYYTNNAMERIASRNPLIAYEKLEQRLAKRTRLYWLKRFSVAAACIIAIIGLSTLFSHRKADSEFGDPQIITLQANAGVRTRFNLPDGTVVYLNSGSVLSYPMSYDQKERKVYLSPIIDCFDGMPITWTVGTSPNAELVNTMLDNAIVLLKENEHPIVHSDRGCHYRWSGWIQRMDEAGLTRSMSKKGCSPDNSACEGFFGRMKNEMFYGEKWDKISVEEFISIINQYMQWYRDKRIKLSLGGLSPMEYRRSLGIA